MGLDGFSMGNLGLNADLTSAQMANQAEHLAKKENEIKIKDVTQLADDQGVKRKDEEANDPKEQFNDGFRKKKQELQESEKEKAIYAILNEKDLENKDPKDFSIRINSATDMIELFNNKNEKILETISAKDLMELMSKLNSAAGILVNKKI